MIINLIPRVTQETAEHSPASQQQFFLKSTADRPGRSYHSSGKPGRYLRGGPAKWNAKSRGMLMKICLQRGLLR